MRLMLQKHSTDLAPVSISFFDVGYNRIRALCLSAGQVLVGVASKALKN